jgi:pseudouridine synthase
MSEALMNSDTIRLDKLLAQAGIASRRAAADLVKEGRIKVNAAVILKPGHRLSPDARVDLDDKPIPTAPARRITIALNKPRGYICSTSSAQGKTVYELLGDLGDRLVPAGRLDKNSEGLLILSSDGDLINHLTHPSYGHPKIYRVTVSGTFGNKTLSYLNSVSSVAGKRISPVGVEKLKEGAKPGRTILQFRLNEGRKRQIREMCKMAGLRVHRLVRTQIGALELHQLDLSPGQWCKLEPWQVDQLLQ